jgi:hypothetical protein
LTAELLIREYLNDIVHVYIPRSSHLAVPCTRIIQFGDIFHLVVLGTDDHVNPPKYSSGIRCNYIGEHVKSADTMDVLEEMVPDEEAG